MKVPETPSFFSFENRERQPESLEHSPKLLFQKQQGNPIKADFSLTS